MPLALFVVVSMAVNAVTIDTYEDLFSLFYNTPINNAVFHVPASGSSSAKAVRMSFDDDATTEILLLEGENTEETATSPIYDLNGMQKSGISKGWNIVNGKKILIKLPSTLALPTAPNLSNSETNAFCK